MFWQLPVTLGIGVKDADKFSGEVSRLWREGHLAAGKPTTSKYKGVTIKRAPVWAKVYRDLAPLLDLLANAQEEGDVLAALLSYLPRREAPAAFYQAVIDGGYYVSWQEEPLQRRIDAARAQRQAHPREEIPVNASLFLRPEFSYSHVST